MQRNPKKAKWETPFVFRDGLIRFGIIRANWFQLCERGSFFSAAAIHWHMRFEEKIFYARDLLFRQLIGRTSLLNLDNLVFGMENFKQ